MWRTVLQLEWRSYNCRPLWFVCWEITCVWPGKLMNDNLPQKVYTDNCLLILSKRTVWFLTVTKALIGDQCKYSSLAGLQIVKSMDCCIMRIRLRSLAVPWVTLVACFCNHSWTTSSRNQARESMATCTECNLIFWFVHKSPGSLVWSC